MQSLKTTRKVLRTLSQAKINEKRQNLDSDSKNGKQNYQQSKSIK